MAETVATIVGGSVAILLVASTIVCLPRSETIAVSSIPRRLWTILPYGLFLGLVLLANKGLQSLSRELSFLVNYNITPEIHAIEGGFVVWVQSIVPAGITPYFVWSYVIGYSFLLAFPVVAYVLLQSVRYGKELMLAYALNYGLGLVMYTVFIAYGPRNILADVVRQPMFDNYPETMLLTSMVNTNTNVFPSLHTALSVTVMVFAWRTRHQLPRWVPIALVVGVSVILSTMVLGIHWLTDVIVGAGVGVFSAVIAIQLIGNGRIDRFTIPTRPSLIRLPKWP